MAEKEATDKACEDKDYVKTSECTRICKLETKPSSNSILLGYQ
jgi:hypothetical protein